MTTRKPRMRTKMRMRKKHPQHRPALFSQPLEVYAFWSGLASTLISLIQVIFLTGK